MKMNEEIEKDLLELNILMKTKMIIKIYHIHLNHVQFQPTDKNLFGKHQTATSMLSFHKRVMLHLLMKHRIMNANLMPSNHMIKKSLNGKGFKQKTRKDSLMLTKKSSNVIMTIG